LLKELLNKMSIFNNNKSRWSNSHNLIHLWSNQEDNNYLHQFNFLKSRISYNNNSMDNNPMKKWPLMNQTHWAKLINSNHNQRDLQLNPHISRSHSWVQSKCLRSQTLKKYKTCLKRRQVVYRAKNQPVL
jgi:hypothetical protein